MRGGGCGGCSGCTDCISCNGCSSGVVFVQATVQGLSLMTLLAEQAALTQRGERGDELMTHQRRFNDHDERMTLFNDY